MEQKKGQIINFPDTLQKTDEASVLRAKSFRITSGMSNFAQYVRTVKAYAWAGMPYEHIANAGDELGDIVERREIDASILRTSQTKAGEIAEDENKIMAWQNRGEVISVSHQLPSPNPVTGQEVVPITRNLSTQQNQKHSLNVLEGIAVFNNQPKQLSDNPYLQAPANINLKKAT